MPLRGVLREADQGGQEPEEVREISQLDFLCNRFGESWGNVSEDVGERNLNSWALSLEPLKWGPCWSLG